MTRNLPFEQEEAPREGFNFRAATLMVAAFAFVAFASYGIAHQITETLRENVEPMATTALVGTPKQSLAKTSAENRAESWETGTVVVPEDKVAAAPSESLDVDAFIAAGGQ